MKIPASKVPAQVWADKAMRRADLDEVESMLLSSWNDSKQVYRIGKELWDELRIDEADEVPVDALLRLPYGCIFIERRWVDEYEQLLTDDMADTWGEASCYVTRYYEGCFCWVEGRTLFVDSLTHHCEMRHTDDYGSDVAEVRRGMRMWLDTIELPIDEGISLERWYSEQLNAVRKANESMSYACEVTDEELLMTAHSHSYLLEHILGLFSISPPRRPMCARSTFPRRTSPVRAVKPTAPSMTWVSASRLSSRRFAVSTSLRRRGRMAARPDGM